MDLERRIETLRRQVEVMSSQEERDLRLAVKFGVGEKADPNATTEGGLLFDATAHLDDLLLLASTIVVGKMPEERYMDAAIGLARKIEKLDGWLSAGGRLPEGWRKKQMERYRGG